MEFKKDRKSKSDLDQKLWHFLFFADDVIGRIFVIMRSLRFNKYKLSARCHGRLIFRMSVTLGVR